MSIIHLRKVVFLTLLAVSSSAYAQSEPSKLDEVVVATGREKTAVEKVAPLPEIKGEKIYSGKKTTSTDLTALPQIPNQNYRQAFSQTAGLLTSEVGGEGVASINYRGLGDPHEGFNINTLRDGIPISSDMYGYPANYYQPPFDSIASIEFLRGGAGLLYGPHAGGALNYVSRKPSTEPLSVLTKQVFGQKNFYSTYNEISGTKDGVGYLGFFHRRESDGFRDTNSNYDVTNGSISTFYDDSNGGKWNFNLDVYDGSHGEAGGLTLEKEDGLANYNDNRFQTTTPYDRLEITRYAASIGYENKISSTSSISAKLFGGYQGRFSRRQTVGSAEVFGGIYDGENNTIVNQEFSNLGADVRFKQDYDIGSDKQTFTSGVTLYGVDSPFTQQLGDTPYANVGTEQRKLNRYTAAASVFAENRFVFGNFRLTPGVRVENIYQKVDEKLNVAAVDPLREDDDIVTVPLFGLGSSYDLGSATEAYANVSQSYKPRAYQDTIPLSTGDTISNDLKPAHAVTYEAGFRGAPAAWANFDTSAFYIAFDDQFGRVGTNIQNVGNSRTTGFDVSLTVDTIGLYDDLNQSDLGNSLGALKLYGNASFLDAEFTSGPVDGKTPQYAPDYLVRTGLIYDYKQSAKLALLGTFVGSSYADDGNSENRYIPNYHVWDLTAEIPLITNTLSVVGGVNNLFDAKYYSRIRSNGIDPALPRNAYAGVTVKF